ncbi:MAG: tetratricopeptide repeat protein [Deltaproteobacteria bacterium]|nr:tetratricopeptide repeat protein [Deltaproteobacteria bacterium]MBW2128991.1 tetratricopeptide repeat protein [Deltaproteobacteria bacterium]
MARTTKKKRKKPRPPRTTPWIVLILLIAAAGLLWWSWPYLFPESPLFNYLVVEKNGQPLKLLKGEILDLHPRDRLRILEISTNRLFNREIRLYSPDFDVNALFFEEMGISQLIPEKDIFEGRTIKITVKQRNRTLGEVALRVEPQVEDWLERANRIIDKTRKVAFLEKALEQLPGDPEVRKALIEAYAAAEKWKDAARMLEKEAAGKQDEKILTRLLGIYESASDRAGIISVLERLIRLHPENGALHLRLAEELEASGKIQEAIRSYEAALKGVKGPQSAALYKTLGYLYSKTNQTVKAIDAYLEALKRDPKDVNLYYNLSSLYEKEGNKKKADEYLSKAIDLNKADLDGRISLAERYLKEKKLRKAEKYLRQVLKERPDSIEALTLMVSVAEAKKDKKALRDLYLKLLALNPQNDTLLYNIGVLEFEMGNQKKGAKYLERFLKNHPNDRETHNLLFDIYRRLKRADQAYKEALTLIRLNPKDPTPYVYIFEYADKRGAYQKLIPILGKGLQALPHNESLREYLVVAYLKTGAEEAALLELKRLVKSRPRDVSLLLQVARLQDKKGRLKEALETYRRILDISPQHEEARKAYIRLLLEQARILENEGRERDALEVYKKVLKIDPSMEEAEDAYLRLRLKVLPHETRNP